MRNQSMLLLAAVALMLALSSGLAESGISCYECNYTNSASETSTCRNPLTSSEIRLCSPGQLCHTMWGEYSAPSHSRRIHGCVDNSSDVPTLDECTSGAPTNSTYFRSSTYFIYQDQCCSSTGQVLDYGFLYRIAECFCRTSNCNAMTDFPKSNSTAEGFPMSNSTAEGDPSNARTSGTEQSVSSTSSSRPPGSGSSSTSGLSRVQANEKVTHLTMTAALMLLNILLT